VRSDAGYFRMRVALICEGEAEWLSYSTAISMGGRAPPDVNQDAPVLPPAAVRKLGKLQLDRRGEPGMRGHSDERLRSEIKSKRDFLATILRRRKC
jgi:hypothetical protein